MKKKLIATLFLVIMLAHFTPAYSQTCADICSLQYNVDYNNVTDNYRSDLYDVLYDAVDRNQEIWQNVETMLDDPYQALEDVWSDIQDLFTDYLPNMWEETDQMRQDWEAAIEGLADQQFACMADCANP